MNKKNLTDNNSGSFKYSLRAGGLVNWTPKYILVMMADIKNTSAGNTVKFDFTTSALYNFDPNSQKIEDFVVALRDGGALPQPIDVKPGWITGDSDEEFRVNQDCYVVLCLRDGWFFSKKQQGLTMDTNPAGDYSDLWEVSPGHPPTPITSANGITYDNCQIMYLSAHADSPPMHRDHGRIFVQNANKPHLAAAPIDPDIKNDGGPPNWQPQ